MTSPYRVEGGDLVVKVRRRRRRPGQVAAKGLGIRGDV